MENDTPGVKIEEINYNNRCFYKSTFMSIEVVRTNDEFYNATKMIQCNGYSDFNRISRLQFYKKFYDNLIQTCRFNIKTNQIEKVYKKSEIDEEITSPQKMVVRETSENYREIQESDLVFEIKSQYSYSWMNGTYIHKWLFERVLQHVDEDYALTVSIIISNIDKELQLRNISLEEKISEQTKTINDLEIAYKNSNKVKLHNKKSSIVITKSNRGSDNCYLVKFKNADVSESELYQNSIVIGSVYNVNEMRNLFVFYSKIDSLDFIKLINGSMYEIYDMNKVIQFINDLQESKFEFTPNFESILNTFVMRNYSEDDQFKGRLFEFFCWKEFDLPIYKYDKTESLSMNKSDRGIDLLSIPKKTIAQCKYYHKTAITKYKLRSFIDFCSDEYFNDWKKILYVNSKAKINKDLYDYNFEIVIVDETKFDEFVSTIKKPEDLELEYDGKTLISLKIKPSLRNEITDYIRNKLQTVHSITLADMVTDVNKHFRIDLNQNMFCRLFDQTYRKTKTGAIPRDKNGTKILMKEINFDEECKWITETIGYGEYKREELVGLHNIYFETDYGELAYTRRFSDLFEHEVSHQRSIVKKVIDGKSTTVLNLIKEDKYEVFKSYIDENKPTVEEFNKHFHRYENKASYGNLLMKIREKEMREFINVHELTNESRILFNKTFNKRFDMEAYKRFYENG